MTTKITPTRSQMTYDGMLEILNGKISRTVGNNTTLRIDTDQCIRVRLHNTDVVTYNPNGAILLDTGGWFTVTTRNRMDTWSPVLMMQKNFVWFVCAISDIQGYYDADYETPEGWKGAWISHATGLPMANGEFYKRSQSVPFFDRMDVSDLVAEIS